LASESVSVTAARIPDRDRLLDGLIEVGLAARPIGEVEIEVDCADDRESVTDDVYHQVEKLIMSVGAPFVPIKHEGVIYVRPPVG
jgi:hypothetical protein